MKTGLFCGNYDRGINLAVTNIDGAFGAVDGVRGRLARKCRAVAPRAAHYLGPQDAAILYDPLPREYADYCAKLYGFTPRTFAPKRRAFRLADEDGFPIAEHSLSIMDDLFDDGDLCYEISFEGRAKGWTISPFIQHESVYEFGQCTGLPVGGMEEAHVRSGRVVDLNNKALFQNACRKLGVPVAKEAEHVRGWGNVLKAAQRCFDKYRAVMLRQACGAGGLGNLAVTGEDLERERCPTLYQQLEPHLAGHAGWDTDTVLVEPLYRDVVCSPAVLCYIAPAGTVSVVAESVQVLRDHAFLGSIIPSGLDQRVVARVTEDTVKYAEWAASRGARGYINVDWLLRTEGELLACESNYRFTAAVHPSMIRDRLVGAESAAIAWSNDALHVPATVSFDRVLGHLDNRGIGWDPKRGEGIIVTIPPAEGSMGYVALAKTPDEAARMNTVMAELETEHAGHTAQETN